MTVASARYAKGIIVLDSPVDWPEGSQVEIRLIGNSNRPMQSDQDDEQDNSPGMPFKNGLMTSTQSQPLIFRMRIGPH